MRRSAPEFGFTLLEMLAAMAVLALVGALVAQMLGGSLRTVALARGQMDALRETRALSDALEADLRRATICQTPGRYLNMQVDEDEDAVHLALSIPSLQIRSLEQYGNVAQVIYRWDKKTKQLQRAEYHSSREADSVLATGSSEDGSDLSENERRLRQLSPAYAADSPFDWIQSPPLLAELKRAASTPLLAAVADFEITCYKDRALLKAGDRNAWPHSDRLPAVLRVRAKLAATPALARSATAPGLRFLDLYLPVAQFSEDEEAR